MLVEFSQAESEQLADDEAVGEISKRLIERNRKAYNALRALHSAQVKSNSEE